MATELKAKTYLAENHAREPDDKLSINTKILTKDIFTTKKRQHTDKEKGSSKSEESQKESSSPY